MDRPGWIARRTDENRYDITLENSDVLLVTLSRSAIKAISRAERRTHNLRTPISVQERG